MARGINKVILIGNLGRDPETRYSQGGSPVTTFSLATTDQWRDRDTNEQQERTEWHRIVCFRRLAEVAGQYLRKGSKCYIEGSLQTRSWEDREGQTRYTTEIVAREMQMLDGRGGDASADYAPPPGGAPLRNVRSRRGARRLQRKLRTISTTWTTTYRSSNGFCSGGARLLRLGRG